MSIVGDIYEEEIDKLTAAYAQEIKARDEELAKLREALRSTENAAEVTRRLNEKLLDQLHEARKTIEKLKAEAAEAEAEEKQLDAQEQEWDRRVGKAIRTQTNGILAACLSPETRSRLWGPDLEELGRAIDLLILKTQGKTKCAICGAPDRETCGHWTGKL